MSTGFLLHFGQKVFRFKLRDGCKAYHALNIWILLKADVSKNQTKTKIVQATASHSNIGSIGHNLFLLECPFFFYVLDFNLKSLIIKWLMQCMSVHILQISRVDSEDACYEFKQEQNLIHRTHLYYLDFAFPSVSNPFVLKTLKIPL